MSLQEIRRYEDNFAAGRIEADAVIDALLPYLSAEARILRETALGVIVDAAVQRPERTTDVVDAVAERLDPGPGAELSDHEFRSLRDLARVQAQEFQPLVDHLGTVAAGRGSSATPVDLAVGALGEIGAHAPGVAKPELGSLLAAIQDSYGTVRREAMWALLRTVTAEPAVIRPLIAGRIWSLDEEDPRTVAKALDDLGAVGWAIPDELVAFDSIAERIGHPVPAVRESALRAVGRIGGTPTVGHPLGETAPEYVSDAVPDIIEALNDPALDVRLAAANTVLQLADAEPSLFAGRISGLVASGNIPDRQLRGRLLRALRRLIEAGVINSTSRSQVERLFLQNITDNDEVTREAALKGLGTLIEQLHFEHGADTQARTLAELVLWRQIVLIGDEYAPVDAHLPFDGEELVALCDVDQLVAVITHLCFESDYEGASPEAGIEILGLLLEELDTVRWDILAEVTEYLGSELAPARCEAIEVLGDAAAEDERVATAIGDILLTQFAYDPETRDTTTTAILEASSHDIGLVASAIETCLEAPDVEDDDYDGRDTDDTDDGGLTELVEEALEASSSDSLEEYLVRFAHERPTGAASTADMLATTLTKADEPHPSTAVALAKAVAGGGTLERRHDRALRALLTDTDIDISLKAWAAATLLIAETDTETQQLAESLIHSLFQRRDHDGIAEVLEVLAAHRPDLVAGLLDSVRPGKLDSTMRKMARSLVTSDPRVITAMRPFIDSRNPPRGREETIHVRLAETAPHAVKGDERLTGPVVWKDTETLAAVVDAIDPDVEDRPGETTRPYDFDTWKRYPDPEIRQQIRARLDKTGNESENSAPELTDAESESLRVEDIDELAAILGRCGEPVSRRVCHLLVTAAVEQPANCTQAVSHLLIYASTARSSTSRRVAVRALAMLAPPGSLPDDPSNPDFSTRRQVLRRHVSSEASTVRAVAVDALASLEETPSSRTFATRAADEHPAVQARSLRAFAENPTLVSEQVLEPFVTHLHGHRRVEATALAAIGRAAAAGVDIELETLNTVRGQLTAEHRSVRRAAATALERITRHDEDAARRVAETLFARLRVDTASRRELVRAVGTVSVHDVRQVNVAAEQLTTVLFETPYSDASAVAGRLLTELAEIHPSEVGPHVRNVGDKRIDGESSSSDEPSLPLAEFHLYRTLAVCCEHAPTTADPYAPLVRATVTGETGADFSEQTVETRALQAAAGTVAAYRGFECYLEVLETYPTDSGLPAIDLDDAAVFLATVGGDRQAEALDTLVESASTIQLERLVEALADLEFARADSSATVGALGALVPEVDARSVQRAGIATQLDHRNASHWVTRRTVVTTLRDLGASGVIPAEEAIAHLLSCLSDRDRRVRSATAESIVSLLRRSCLDGMWLIETRQRQAIDADADAASRSGSIALLGALARERPPLRTEAIAALATILKTTTFRLRRDVIEELNQVATVAPAAIEKSSVDADRSDRETPIDVDDQGGGAQ